MVRRCSVIRMPLAAQSASILLFSGAFFPTVATMSLPLPPYSITQTGVTQTRHNSDQVSAQHQRGGGLAPGARVIIGAAGYFMKTGAVIKADGRRVMFVDFQKYGARAQAGEPPHMQIEQAVRQPASAPRLGDRDREDFRLVLDQPRQNEAGHR